MKHLLAISIATLMAGTSLAVAQQSEMYLNREESGTYRIFGPDNTEGTELLVGENGASPADCPEGSFYRNADNMIAGCGTDEVFGVAPIEEGTMMSSGQAYPKTSFWLQPNGQPISDDGAEVGVSGTETSGDSPGAAPGDTGADDGTTGSIGPDDGGTGGTGGNGGGNGGGGSGSGGGS